MHTATITRSLPFSHSRHSSLSTTWCRRRCWQSLKTPRTSCWSSLRIFATCSETLHCTARPSSSPAPLHPTTTHGRSREGTEKIKCLGIELKYQVHFLPKLNIFHFGHNRAGKLRSRGLFLMKERTAPDVGQPNVRVDLKTVVRKGTRSTAIAWRRGRSFRT